MIVRVKEMSTAGNGGTAGRGIRQFLDIGTGIPKGCNVHKVAQREAPETRVAYVDRNPIVLAHARQLLRGTPEGATSYFYGVVQLPSGGRTLGRRPRARCRCGAEWR